MLCRISDGSGFLTLPVLLFHPAQQHNGLARGVRIRCFGEARRGPQGLEIVHPEYRRGGFIRRESRGRSSHADLSRHRRRHAGPAAAIGRPGIGSDRPPHDLKDWPARRGARGAHWLPSLLDALLYVHRPAGGRAPWSSSSNCGIGAAVRRWRSRSCWAHQLSLKLLRQKIQSDPGLAAGSTDGAG